MPTPANTLLSLIIISLGILGIIMSFNVADKKKSLLSLGLSLLIIVVGIFELSSSSIKGYQINRRMRQIREEQQTTINKMQEQLKQKAQEAVVTQSPSPKKP